MILSQPLIFQSDNGIYMYDDSTCIILPITQEERVFLESLKIGTSIDKYPVTKSTIYIQDAIRQLGLFSKKSEVSANSVTPEFVQEQVKDQGIKHMCLVVTDDCNLRCKYCIYSDHYYYSKGYSNTSMSVDTAKKAIDYYFEINNDSIKRNPQLIPSIGYYGGEPLLNWSVITESVKYAQSYAKDCVFAITTNGMLLDRNKIEFMLNNNFAISVSLDGGKPDHDRNRIDCSGEGTFDRVFERVLLLQEIIDERIDANEKNKMFYIPHKIQQDF